HLIRAGRGPVSVRCVREAGPALVQSCAMPGPLASRNVDDSRVTMTEIVMPEDTNHHGNIFGGRVLALIDKASAVAAMRHCHAPVVTASIDRVDFLAGAKQGSILILEAALNAVFRTSMEVGVIVLAEDPLS